MPIALAGCLVDVATSVIAWNRTDLRRLVREVAHRVIDEAISPSFGRIVAFNYWVIGCLEVLPGMLIGRVIAPADMTAAAAHPQMNPLRAYSQAVLASFSAWFHLANRISMNTSHHLLHEHVSAKV